MGNNPSHSYVHLWVLFKTHVWVRVAGKENFEISTWWLTVICSASELLPNIAGRVGFEPTTCGLTVRCTNRCAISQYKKMLCWRRESLSHLDLTTHTNNMSARGVRLSTFNLLQRISNYAFSNTFCGCNRIRTYVCYQLHGHSPEESLHASKY